MGRKKKFPGTEPCAGEEVVSPEGGEETQEKDDVKPVEAPAETSPSVSEPLPEKQIPGKYRKFQ